jgi:hypothetical protein
MRGNDTGSHGKATNKEHLADSSGSLLALLSERLDGHKAARWDWPAGTTATAMNDTQDHEPDYEPAPLTPEERLELLRAIAHSRLPSEPSGDMEALHASLTALLGEAAR